MPLNNPAATTGDRRAADQLSGRSRRQERLVREGALQHAGGPLEPAAVACHDIVVHMEHNLAGAACAEQGQVWEIDPEHRDPGYRGPDDGRRRRGQLGRPGQFPGAVDFFHSVMFNNAGTVVNWVDESFGSAARR